MVNKQFLMRLGLGTAVACIILGLVTLLGFQHIFDHMISKVVTIIFIEIEILCIFHTFIAPQNFYQTFSQTNVFTSTFFRNSN